jgi:hypothetical protein
MYLMERISDPAAWNLERAIRARAYSDPRLQSHVATLDEWAFGQVGNCFQQLGFAGIDADIRAKTLYYAGTASCTPARWGRPSAPSTARDCSSCSRSAERSPGATPVSARLSGRRWAEPG